MQIYNKQTIAELFELPFLDLIYQAQTILRQNFPANEIELSKILSVKTGGCPENCGYCTQSAHHKTGLKKESLTLAQVAQEAALAKNNGIKIAADTGLLANIRHIGSIVAADLVGVDSFKLYKLAMENGAILRPIGNCLYWLPPLNMSAETLEELADITKKTLLAVHK